MLTKNLDDNWSTWHHRLHKEFLRDQKLIPKGSDLLIAVSGGQDSMAMLNLINDIRIHHQWNIYVWHGNHKWHEKSNHFANALKKYCESKDINFYSDTAINVDINSEEKARDWRYQKLCEKVDELSIKNNLIHPIHILTGHTSSDNAETFLMNLARGSNYSGLSGIQRKRFLNEKYSLIRPLLIFSREDTKEICKSLNVPVWEDPTNSDLDIKRNIIRINILDHLEKIYPGCTNRINNFIEKMNSYGKEQSDLSQLALISCSSINGVNRILFKKLGKEARATILNRFIKDKCIKQISSKHINDLSFQIINKSNGTINLPEGWTMTWDKEFIEIKN